MTGTTPPAPPPRPEEGGDAACWLDRVCPECGAFAEGAEGTACWRCGAVAVAEE